MVRASLKQVRWNFCGHRTTGKGVQLGPPMLKSINPPRLHRKVVHLPSEFPAGLATLKVTASAHAASLVAQANCWSTTIKANLEPLSIPQLVGYARWRKNLLKVSHRTVEPRVPLSVTRLT